MSPLQEQVLILPVHVVFFTGNVVYHKAVVIKLIEYKFILLLLLCALAQLLLQRPYLTFLDDPLDKTVITCHKQDQQEQDQHYPILVPAYQDL